jgi:putative spermidine/putrescine transport system substrate-binding protein
MKFLFKPIVLAAALSVSAVHAAEIVVVNFGGALSEAMKAALMEPFEKATGNKAVSGEYNGGSAKIKAMVEAKKVSWDVVQFEAGDIGRACEEGLLEKIDMKKIGNKADFIPGAVHECGVGAFVWSTVLAYDANKLKTAPKSWADFWDVKKFPGKRGMRQGPLYNLQFALMADGVPSKDVYKVLATKAGADRAFKKLEQLKPYIQWWDSGSQATQFVVAGDVVMTTVYNGRVDLAQRDGKNVQLVWPGSIYDIDYWVIPKGTPNKDTAEKFIAYASSPEAQKALATRIAYGPTNLKAFQLLDAKTMAKLPSTPANAKEAIGNDLKFWTDHGEELQQRFSAWAAK